MNYLVLRDSPEFGGIAQFSLFTPTSDELLYECVQQPQIELGLETLQYYTEIFTPAHNLEATTKMQALADRILDGDLWMPAIGDYFTDIDNALRLYLITNISGGGIDFVTISGGALEEDEAAESGFSNTRVSIVFDESGSGS